MRRTPTARLVCVGSELLAGQVNTHQAWLSTRLRAAGFEVAGERSARDTVAEIRDALARALSGADAVIVTGGLGPTFDDLTREAAASVLRRPLRFEPRVWKTVLAKFARRGLRRVPEQNKRQAEVIRGAVVLDNATGSAPGLFLTAGAKSLVLLPGPRGEMAPMFERLALPRLKARHARGLHPASLSVRLFGVPESEADERLAPVRARWPRARFTILASGGEVSFHATLTERSATAARAARARLRREVLDAVGRWAYGEGEDTLESVAGARLKSRRLTLAVAESCTGGLLGARITTVPGSSSWFLGGVLAYANSVKTRRLGVPARVLARHGAVSAECAAAMARGARRATGASVGVAITGVAGPGGGTKDKPVGLVWLAVDGPGGRRLVRRRDLHGGREAVRERAAAHALALLLEALP